MDKDVSFKIGRSASLAMAIATIIFAVSLIWEMVQLSAFAMNLGYVASIFIAISVVITMACFHDAAREKFKIYGVLALAASIIYAPLCIGTYFLQLTAVAQNPLNLSDEVLKAITFKPGSPVFAMDMLGYCFLCLSTLAAAFAVTKARDKALRILCFIHGALAVPTVAAPIISGLFLTTSGETDFTGHYVLLFWCAVFVPIALLFMRYFKEEQDFQGGMK